MGRRAVRQSARKVVTYAEGEEETEANEDISENGGDDEQNGEDDCANLDDEDFE